MRTQRAVIYLLILAAFSNGVLESSIGPLVPTISSGFKASLSFIGLMISINTLCILISSMTTGILIGKFSHKTLLIFGVILTILGSLGLFLSPDFLFFIIFCAIMGLGIGTKSISLTSYICDLFPNKNSSQLLKLNTGWLAGVFVAPIFVTFIAWYNFTWQNLFLILSLTQIPLLLIIIFTNFKKVLKTETDKTQMKKTSLKTLFNAHFILSCIIVFIYSAVTRTFSFWFTTYFSSINIDLKISSIFLTIYTAATIIGMYLKRFLLRSYNEKKILIFNSTIAVFSLFSAFMIDNILLKLLFIIIFGINIIGFISITISIETQLRPGHSAPIAGIISGTGSLSIIISQYVTGFLSENFSKSSVFYIDLILLLLLCILVIVFYFFDKINKEGKTSNTNQIFPKT